MILIKKNAIDSVAMDQVMCETEENFFEKSKILKQLFWNDCSNDSIQKFTSDVMLPIQRSSEKV